ncbi:MAG: hypothetical protein WA584_09455 [Pyrinomonadaceae bacterium]
MVTTNQKIRRLPGFRFEARAASRENILPRMDIALFVGFAASGPIGIPVVLDSAEQFNTIFGKSLPLVWNKEKGEMVYAYLAPTVRAFFRNGGKRCWVVRVARLKPGIGEAPLNRACYNFFPLAGLADVHFHEKETPDFMPAFARSRSKGSWSDDLQIGTATLSRAVKFLSITDDGEQKIARLEIPANEPLKNEELLRLDFSDEGLILYLTADKIEDGSTPNKPPPGKSIVKVTSKRFIWVENLSETVSSPEITSPGEVKHISVRMWTHRNTLSSQDITMPFFVERQAEITIVPQEGESDEKLPPKVKLKFIIPSQELTPAVGSLLASYNEKAEILCMQVEAVNVADSETQADVELTCRAVSCRKFGISPPSATLVERLTFELWIKKDETSFIKLSDLAFNSGQERFWGDLPVDDDLYRFPESRETDAPEIPSWTQAGDLSSFPVAGNGDRDGFYFPVFPTPFPENYLGSMFLPGTALQRDGLEVFDAGLFLDEKLKNTGLNNLLNEGEFIRYLSQRPRSLRGIHSALVPETTTGVAAESTPTNPVYTSFSLDEATIISVPDAVHLGWYHETDTEGPVLPPPPAFPPPERPDWWHFQDCRKPDIKPVSEPLWGNFLDCGLRVVAAPKDLNIKETKVSSGKFTLIWNCNETDESIKFVLEESLTPGFEPSQVIYTGKEKEFKITERGTGIYYYRVRAEIGKFFSNWSNGLTIKVPAADNWVTNASRAVEGSSNPNIYKPDVLLAVQRALLRMCAARGDIFAVLSLPEHYEKDDAVRHITTLKTTKGLIAADDTGVEPFSADETKALSFGALYHPWLITRGDNVDTVLNVPASGAICGVMAQRAARRGAWIAPANEALQEVVGLATEFGRESFLDFQDGLINLVRQEPTGFMVLDSDTLSDDFDLRQINVRRLLSLLRRLALKHGTEYVFEPNNERFRRQVQRGFSSLLDLMFMRGAFAGETPATSYQVVVSETINNFQSLEQGRFIVELRVAPSLPLKFVTVRLVQAGGRTTVAETV